MIHGIEAIAKIAFSSSTLQTSPSPQFFPGAWSKCSHTASKSTHEIDVLHSIWWSLFDLRLTAQSAWKVLYPDWTLPHPAITLPPWLKFALAIAIRCFSPPEKLLPFSQTICSIPNGLSSTIFSSPAFFTAALISSSGYS